MLLPYHGRLAVTLSIFRRLSDEVGVRFHNHAQLFAEILIWLFPVVMVMLLPARSTSPVLESEAETFFLAHFFTIKSVLLSKPIIWIGKSQQLSLRLVR